MQQVEQIAEIIEKVLYEYDVDTEMGADVMESIAQHCAVNLVKASLDQLANLLGGEINEDEHGQPVLNLGALF
jgi:hypothetical protein